MLKHAISKLVEGKSLSEQEIMGAMECIMEGSATSAQIGSFLTALRIKGETIEEITGCARVMRAKASRIQPDIRYYIDTCGTGGDGTDTFNISTTAAIIAAAGGVPVAKHGNRSVSSRSGSADVLEALGVNIDLSPQQVKECMEKVGIGFLFAPSFHKSMKHAAGPRKELGIRSIFNILGPLTNPANAKGQVLGVFDGRLTEPVANVLMNLGLERALVVHGQDGMDEITLTAVTKVSEVIHGSVITYEIVPEQFGMSRCTTAELTGGDAQENADIIRGIFRGVRGPRRDIAVINAAAALYVGRAVRNLHDGVKTAEEMIDSGKAGSKLKELKEFTGITATDRILREIRIEC
jgi:anthranilate phosphoribosyltransferase